MAEAQHPSKVSVVIGSQNARATVAECLAALESNATRRGLEIVVADNSTDGTPEIVKDRFPHAKLLRLPANALMPELWEAGIRESTGEIIAVTTAHCVPGKDWVGAIVKAHELPYPGIGGAIESGQGAGLVDWAVYFCRYSGYMRPFVSGVVAEIPGDNASYKRWALDRCVDVRRKGFWEPEIHAVLRRDGYQLFMDPSIVVYHERAFGILGFMRQRFHHGRHFGESRAARFSASQRLLYAASAPLIPLIFLARISRQVLTKGRHQREFLLSLPILLLFLLSWSAGEWCGYVWKRRR